MTTFRAFTSALLLAAFVSGPAHAEMVSATKPSKTAEGGKAKHDTKSHTDKTKHASVEKKKPQPHDRGAKANKEKSKAHHAAARTTHAPPKNEKKHAAAKPKAPHEAHKDAHPDKRIATRDRQKERHGNH
jgi:hypothetical protein